MVWSRIGEPSTVARATIVRVPAAPAAGVKRSVPRPPLELPSSCITF